MLPLNFSMHRTRVWLSPSVGGGTVSFNEINNCFVKSIENAHLKYSSIHKDYAAAYCFHTTIQLHVLFTRVHSMK